MIPLKMYGSERRQPKCEKIPADPAVQPVHLCAIHYQLTLAKSLKPAGEEDKRLLKYILTNYETDNCICTTSQERQHKFPAE
jgi:hypothetical protein